MINGLVLTSASEHMEEKKKGINATSQDVQQVSFGANVSLIHPRSFILYSGNLSPHSPEVYDDTHIFDI